MASAGSGSGSMSVPLDPPTASREKNYGHGHVFSKKTFHKPTYCHHCTDMLWGLIGQGYICEVCNFVVHDRCLKTVVSPCVSIAASLVTNPVAHCWSEPAYFKRKFCNVCRKRIEDSSALRCEICEYYVHMDCQDFAVADCKTCATYVPDKDAPSVVHFHHWREGNLPANSKCLWCKKACWSVECLAGMRCEWCGTTVHAACHKNIAPDCIFGMLQSIMVPPSCVSIPRTDVPMETCMGVPTKKREGYFYFFITLFILYLACVNESVKIMNHCKCRNLHNVFHFYELTYLYSGVFSERKII